MKPRCEGASRLHNRGGSTTHAVKAGKGEFFSKSGDNGGRMMGQVNTGLGEGGQGQECEKRLIATKEIVISVITQGIGAEGNRAAMEVGR